MIDSSRKCVSDDIFELVMRNYNEANKDYLQKQIEIASENLTDQQKEDLRQKGVHI